MRKHPFDLTSLLAGLVFAAVAAVYLLGQATGNSIDATWVLPVALVALGLAGVAGGIGRVAGRPSGSTTDQTMAVSATEEPTVVDDEPSVDKD